MKWLHTARSVPKNPTAFMQGWCFHREGVLFCFPPQNFGRKQLNSMLTLKSYSNCNWMEPTSPEKLGAWNQFCAFLTFKSNSTWEYLAKFLRFYSKKPLKTRAAILNECRDIRSALLTRFISVTRKKRKKT